MGLSFKGYVITFIVVGLFLTSITSWAVQVGEDYDQTEDFVDSSKIDLVAIQEELNTTSESAGNWQASFTSDNFFVSLGSIVLFSIWGIFKLMWTSIMGFITIYFEIAYNVFGLDPIVSGTAIALLIIGLIFAVWRTIKAGE